MNAALIDTGKRLVAPVVRVHHLLLGENNWVGWTPYLWLPYAGFVFLDCLYRPVSNLELGATIAAVAVFLVLYFAGYRSTYRAERIKVITALVVLSLILMPVNSGGGAFCIYAAAFCGFMNSMRRGLIALGLVLAVVAIESIILRFNFWTWFPFLLFAMIIGLSNIYFGEMSRKNRALKQSQEEIRRLAATAERERIARDLHDILGHTLTLITVKAELAARLTERDMAAAAREMRELEKISRDALKQVREAVGGYRSGGLAGELANARIALASANVELHVHAVQPVLSPAHDNLLAMVLREAVTNVVRHAGAARCNVRILLDGGVVSLSVEDNGRGSRLREGNGISGMRERLAALDGSLDIHSDRHGTRLTARLPSPEAEPAAFSGRIAAAR